MTFWQILNIYQILIIQNIEKQTTNKMKFVTVNNEDFLVCKIV